MSNSRCMKWRSVPWFSFRLAVTAAKKGFLASKGLGGEESSAVIGRDGSLNLPAPRGPLRFHRTQGTLEPASKGPRKTLQICERFSQPDPRQGPQQPPKVGKTRLSVPYLQIRKQRLAPKTRGDPPRATCLQAECAGGPGPLKTAPQDRGCPGPPVTGAELLHPTCPGPCTSSFTLHSRWS